MPKHHIASYHRPKTFLAAHWKNYGDHLQAEPPKLTKLADSIHFNYGDEDIKKLKNRWFLSLWVPVLSFLNLSIFKYQPKCVSV